MSQTQPSDVWNWRQYFTNQTLLKNGEHDARTGIVTDFKTLPDMSGASCKTVRGFNVEVRNVPRTPEELENYPDWNRLERVSNTKRKLSWKNYYSCDCSSGMVGTPCRHVASLLFYWESVHGLFIMKETPEEREARLRRKKEKEELEQKKKTLLPAYDIFEKTTSPLPAGSFYRTRAAFHDAQMSISQYDAEQAEQLEKEATNIEMHIHEGYLSDGSQGMKVDGKVGSNSLKLTLSHQKIHEFSCSCGETTLGYNYYYSSAKARICAHGLLFWKRLHQYISVHNPGDQTDKNGANLLSILSGEVLDNQEASTENDAAVKKADVELVPRIVEDDGELKLCFDIAQEGGRRYLIKSFEALTSSVENEQEMVMGKTCTIRFSEETFTKTSDPWFQLISTRVATVRNMNNMIHRGYHYYPNLSAGSSLPMTGATLDQLFDLLQGQTILYQWGSRNDTYELSVEEIQPEAKISLTPKKEGQKLTGIIIAGNIPLMLSGAKYQYILKSEVFGRVSGEGLGYLKPFIKLAGNKAKFECIIGEKKFPEFAFRILPALRESKQIILDDHLGDLLNDLLPPEPEFTFYIDLEEKITCKTIVQYGENSVILGFTPVISSKFGRDPDQEKRVLTTVQKYFHTPSPATQQFEEPADDDHLMQIMTDGVAALSRFGVVKGSDSFRKVSIRPTPKTGLSIRLENDLLDLSIKTNDLTSEELLELLSSYRQKKKWHRLRSGDFVDLRNPESLSEMDQALKAMNLTMEDLLKGNVHLPKYRAMYVDKLLEGHDEIASSRNRQFKSLVRSFQTIRDSDFEAPESLSDQLRPYQLYGFRWLSTLSQFGFGGILADEMGLGKTLQMLTWMLSQRKSGDNRPFLVICPASLVYNWGEECRKFTPELSSVPIDGTLSVRKKILQGAAEGMADLYITSYDLLRRDIELYHNLHFSAVVLDEAQVIKNQRANVSKAVRVLNAAHRFALTGTPIENRLAELWSIFDFLMPGFLYTSSEFSTRYEIPIMKQKDPEVTQQLARMTEPFVLRRKKTDVLKDLPEKLEEIQTADMKDDQRKLYDAQVVHMRELLSASTENNEDKMRILAEITRLRQICCDPSLIFENYHGSSAKREACLDLIQSAMDGGHRMLVFSQFTSMLDLLAADLKKANIPFYTITGSTPKQERLKLVNDFNSNDIPVFLISLKAGGTGLNLTGADVVIHYDPWWNLAVQNQATDRAHRIGQTKQVTVMKLIAADSIEEKIVELQEAKRELADAIISGQSSSSLMSLSREELLALIE